MISSYDNKKKDPVYRGKHIGGCSCGFSLLADSDTKCPRCRKKITKGKK